MKGDNARKETSTASSRILNRSGDAGDGKGDNDLANSPSASGEIRAHDPAPSGAQSSTNPTTSRRDATALVDTAASILRNALTIAQNAGGGTDTMAEALDAIAPLLRQALHLVEQPERSLGVNPELARIPLYRPDPVTPPAAYLAQQLKEIEQTNRELAGDPFALLDPDPPAGSGR